MGLLSSFFGVDTESRAEGLSPSDVFGMGLESFGTTSKSGEVVNAQTSLSISAVFGSLRVISEGISSMPIGAVRENDVGVATPVKKPDWMKFRVGPWTQMDVIGQCLISLMLWGNCYIATYRDALGKVLWLEVLDPEQVTPERVGPEIRYRIEGQQTTLSNLDILHIRGMSMPGKTEGLSVLSVARESLGLSIATTKFGATFFGNGALPGAVAEVEGEMSPTGQKAFRRNWEDLHKGAGNSNKIAILTQGAKISKLTIPPDDAQFLQTRQFQVNDIARFFGVPTSKLAHSDGPEMGKSIEDKGTEFVTDVLRPWATRLETAFTWLIQSEARINVPRNVCAKIDLSALQRGSFSTRMATNIQLVREGIVTINEVRAEEGKPPVAWGDEPISVQVQEEQEQAPPETEPPPSEDDDEENEQ